MTITGTNSIASANAVSAVYAALSNLQTVAAAQLVILQGSGATSSASNVQALLTAIGPSLTILQGEAEAFSEANQ